MQAISITHKACVRTVARAPLSLLPFPKRHFSKLTIHASRTLHPLADLSRPLHPRPNLSNSFTSRMASYSNTDTGSKPADPYKEKNFQEPDLKVKVEDLVAFIEHCKFGMMTTRVASTGLLTSRCMALAAKVCALPMITVL